MDIVTASRLKDFHACRRLHHIRYGLGYRSRVVDPTLAFGLTMHAGLEAWWEAHRAGNAAGASDAALAAVSRNDNGLDAVALAKAELLIVAYDARWSAAMADLEVLGGEVPFEAPIWTPTGKPCRTSRAAGKIDVIVRRISDDSIWVVEHKTTGADLTHGSTYWTRLRMDAQVSIYFDGAATTLREDDIAGCVYDVIVRPDARPHAATPADKRKYTKDGRLYANQREADETMDDFKARMAADIEAAPQEYFQRVEVVRMEAELQASRRDVYEAAQLLRAGNRTGHHPRNVDACLRFGGRPCAFFDVCSGVAELDTDPRFTKVDNIHPELSK